MNRAKTIFLDIDGTLVEHSGSIVEQYSGSMNILPGTLDKLSEWDRKGYNIILTTGRREGMRDVTEKQLKSVGIFFDRLIMGIGGGPRILVNDRKLNKTDDTAFAVNLTRNEGISKIEI